MTDSTPATAFRRSAWSPRQKVVRALWSTFAVPLWRMLPPLRAPLLRLFGGTIGRRCTLASSVHIEIPWNITLGDDVLVADRVILYSLGPITVGNGCVLDYRTHLCAGTHDFTDPNFPLLRPPITIGANSFLGADVYIAPDVEIGEGSRVAPRSSVHKSCPPGSHLRGNPAKLIEDPSA
ncbi:MAG: DapH/DapD/GlmU-related protein [Planctomycetota bacterium]